MEVRLRSSVADYEVIAELPSVGGGARYLCRTPDRLELSTATVMVTEVAVDAAGWQALTERLTRYSAVSSDRVMSLIEVGPDLDPIGAGVYLATESAPGGWLSDPVEDLDGPSRVQAVGQVAAGLHALHESGVAHGGITARAVVLTGRGAVLAPPPLDLPVGALTRVGAWRDLVTLDPDLLSGEESSRSSDVWALGATLHIALSDRPLYPGIEKDAAVTAIQRILYTRPEIDPDISPDVADVIRSCLEPDPAARPTTAEELADRLQIPDAP
jgi:serine/threonine protein kinase